MDTRIRRWGRGIIVTLVFMVAATFALPTSALVANAADASSLAVPSGTTEIWVDAEAANIASGGNTVSGSLEGSVNATLQFKTSPSGATAIASVSHGNVTVKLAANEAVRALVAVTFVDADGNVLAAYASHVALQKAERPVAPKPAKPGPGANVPPAATNSSGFNGRMGKTGSAVMVIVFAMLCLVGVGLVLKKFGRGQALLAAFSEKAVRR